MTALRASARSEFEKSRSETDQEIIAKMMIVGRYGLMEIQEKVAISRYLDLLVKLTHKLSYKDSADETKRNQHVFATFRSG